MKTMKVIKKKETIMMKKKKAGSPTGHRGKVHSKTHIPYTNTPM